MQREFVFIVVFALVVAVRSEDPVKCYMCATLINENCRDPKAHDMEPVECTFQEMATWQKSIQSHKLLSPIANIFSVDIIQDHHKMPTDAACAKMDFKVGNQDVTVRSCQSAKAENVDPCKVMEDKLSGNMFSLDYCGLCTEDACNSSVASSPTILYTLFSVFASVMLAAFFHNA